MPTLKDWPCELMLYSPVKHGSLPVGNITGKLAPTWRRSIRSKGGFWIATATLEDDPIAMQDFFTHGLMFELREMLGGLVLFEGFLGQMVFTIGGLPLVRSWKPITNRVKAIYSRIGDNQLTNGGAESGAWPNYGTPTTIEQSTAWKSEGDYSCHIIANWSEQGGLIQSGIPIVAAKAYDCRVSLNILSGAWELRITRDDTGETIASAEENEVGQKQLTTNIGTDNTYAGSISVAIVCTTTYGEVFADAAVFQTSPERADTTWYEDADSQSEYGVMEYALLEAGMSDAAADAKALTQMRNFAWPGAVPPETFKIGETGAKDRLDLTFLGYAFTLGNKYTPITGTDRASDHVNTMIADAEFVDAGIVEDNPMDYQIDPRAPMKSWEVLLDIAKSGDESGSAWDCGVYAGRLFDYNRRSDAVSMHLSGGQIYKAGELLEPWMVTPGLLELDDIPPQPAGLNLLLAQSSRRGYIEEVEFSMAEWLDGKSGLTVKREKTIYD